MNLIEYINKLFGISNEVSAPILITILVFIIGGIISFIYHQIKAYRQRKDYREIFRTMLKEIAADCGIKEMQTKKFYPTLTTDYKGHWALSFTRINYLNTIFELDFNEIFKSFESHFLFSCNKKIKRKAFHKIYSNLDNIKYFESFIKPDLDNFIQVFNKHHVLYKESLSNYNELVDKIKFDSRRHFALVHGPDPVQNYLMALDKIWKEWRKLDELERVNYKITYEMLVEPTLTLNRKFDLEFTLEMNKYLLKCKTQFMEMESILKKYYLTFKNHSRNYRFTKRILKKCLEMLK